MHQQLKTFFALGTIILTVDGCNTDGVTYTPSATQLVCEQINASLTNVNTTMPKLFSAVELLATAFTTETGVVLNLSAFVGQATFFATMLNQLVRDSGCNLTTAFSFADSIAMASKADLKNSQQDISANLFSNYSLNTLPSNTFFNDTSEIRDEATALFGIEFLMVIGYMIGKSDCEIASGDFVADGSYGTMIVRQNNPLVPLYVLKAFVTCTDTNSVRQTASICTNFTQFYQKVNQFVEIDSPTEFTNSLIDAIYISAPVDSRGCDISDIIPPGAKI